MNAMAARSAATSRSSRASRRLLMSLRRRGCGRPVRGPGTPSPVRRRTSPSDRRWIQRIGFGDVTRVLSDDDTQLGLGGDRKSTRLNSSHQIISYAVFCLKKKKKIYNQSPTLKTRILTQI